MADGIVSIASTYDVVTRPCRMRMKTGLRSLRCLL